MPNTKELYHRILDQDLGTIEGFQPEDFVPCKGTVLVIQAPSVKRLGNIELPNIAEREQFIGRVVAVPANDVDCPVCPGDWVFFRMSANSTVLFPGREDIIVLNYCEGMESDILGYIRENNRKPEPYPV